MSVEASGCDSYGEWSRCYFAHVHIGDDGESWEHLDPSCEYPLRTGSPDDVACGLPSSGGSVEPPEEVANFYEFWEQLELDFHAARK